MILFSKANFTQKKNKTKKQKKKNFTQASLHFSSLSSLPFYLVQNQYSDRYIPCSSKRGEAVNSYLLCDIANIALERKSHFLDVYQLRSKNNHLGKISRPKHWCAKLRAQQSTPQELEVLKVPIFNLNLLYIYIVDIAVLS